MDAAADRAPQRDDSAPLFPEAGDIALRLGSLLLQSGASTARVVRAMRNMLAALGMPRAGAVVTPELMTVFSGENAEPYPLIRATPPIRWSIHRLVYLEALVARARSGSARSSYEQVRDELEAIQAIPAPYNRWTLIVAYACAGFSVSQLMHADLAGAAIAALACGVGQFVRSGIAHRFHLATVTFLTAVTASSIGALGVRLGLTGTVRPTITAAVALLIPGLWLVTGGLDVMSRQIRFGFTRLTVAFLLFITIVIGIAFSLMLISIK